jgi:hypothetical protein
MGRNRMKAKNYQKNDSKKQYISPKLILHGPIEDITKAKNNRPKQDGQRRYSQL